MFTFFKLPGERVTLNGKAVHSCFDGDYAHGKSPPPIKNPVKTTCEHCGATIWVSRQSLTDRIINLCEPCYLLFFRGYARRAAYPERN